MEIFLIFICYNGYKEDIQMLVAKMKKIPVTIKYTVALRNIIFKISNFSISKTKY